MADRLARADSPTPTAAPASGALGGDDPDLVAEAPAAQPRLGRGSTAGRYVILDELGAGGMGTVYRAYDPELDRRIALKLVALKEQPGRPLSASRADRSRERLLREAQALAHLSHPNVINVYDVGTLGDGSQATVFVAMELVEGRTLPVWLREARPTPAQIVSMLVQAGRGIAAAHRRGIVHRDFKPDNVIVGHDGRVRVLDFGLARAAAMDDEGRTPRLPDEDLPLQLEGSSRKLLSAITMAGAVVGSPGYMSPEQCLGADIDEKSDQFSFCATLYYALYGQVAFSARSWLELKQKVTQGVVDPPPPHIRVPARLRRIVLKGLAVSPEERYPSMEALLLDLARDPRQGLKRAALAAVIGVVLAAGALGVSLWRSKRQSLCRQGPAHLAAVWDDQVKAAVQASFLATDRPYAAATFGLVSQALDARATAWVAQYREACQATQVRGEQSEHLLDLRMRCLRRQVMELKALTELFSAKADGEVVDRAPQAVAGLPSPESCADLQALASAVPPPEGAALRRRVDGLRQRLDQARALQRAGRFAAALPILRDLIGEARAVPYRPLLAELLAAQGELLADAAEAQASEEALLEACEIAAAVADDELRARAMATLIYTTGLLQARTEEALALGRQAENLTLRAGNAPALRGELLNNLGGVLATLGRYDQALSRYQAGIAALEQEREPNLDRLSSLLNNIAMVHGARGETEQALVAYQKALGIKQNLFGAEHPQVGLAQNNIGSAHNDAGQFELALPYFEQALASLERALGPSHPHVALVLGNLGEALLGVGSDTARARAACSRALEIAEPRLGARHPAIGYYLTCLGNAQIRSGAAAQAVPVLERAARLREELGGDPLPLAITRFTLARALFGSGRELPRARTLARQAREVFGKAGAFAQRLVDEVDRWQGQLEGRGR